MQNEGFLPSGSSPWQRKQQHVGWMGELQFGMLVFVADFRSHLMVPNLPQKVQSPSTRSGRRNKELSLNQRIKLFAFNSVCVNRDLKWQIPPFLPYGSVCLCVYISSFLGLWGPDCTLFPVVCCMQKTSYFVCNVL